MKKTARKIFSTGLSLMFLIPYSAMADEANPQNAHPDEAKMASDILKALNISSSEPIKPDTTLELKQGMSQTLRMYVGESKIVHVTTEIDKAATPVNEMIDTIVLDSNRLQISAQKAGTIDYTVLDKYGVPYKIKIEVSIPVSAPQKAINDALPNEHFTVVSTNNTLILKGSTRDASASASAITILRRFVVDPANAINQIQMLGSQQVMLKVKVSEVDRTVLKQLGMNSAISNPGGNTNVVGNNLGVAQYGLNAAKIGNNTNGGTNPYQAIAGVTNPVAFVTTKAFGSVFTTVVNALESQGLIKTLAEPNLVTMSGKPALLNAGTEYPIPTISQTGTVGTEYHNFGVTLSFVPTVINSNTISLDIATEVSAIGDEIAIPNGTGGSYNTPSFNTRKANSFVELPSGGSIVIGGLISTDMKNTISGIPGWKDIPILGKLFSSASFQHDETELVVTVTAYLVEPTDSSNLTNPTENLVPPSDNDLYFLNRLTGVKRNNIGNPPNKLEQLFGYIME